jgi:hypothetical protein
VRKLDAVVDPGLIVGVAVAPEQPVPVLALDDAEAVALVTVKSTVAPMRVSGSWAYSLPSWICQPLWRATARPMMACISRPHHMRSSSSPFSVSGCSRRLSRQMSQRVLPLL